MLRNIIALLSVLLIATPASAQKECFQQGNKPECKYEAFQPGSVKIVIDGKLDEWRTAKGVAMGKDFWEALGENYTGDKDLSATWWVLWDANNLYVALAVTDDAYQNTKGGNAIYDGDGIQFSIDPTGKKVTHAANVYEYGYSLAGGKGKEKPAVWRWFTNPATKGETSDYAIVRDEAAKMTYYEIRVPKGDIAPADLSVGKTIGWSIIVNESDVCDCQGGWVGWASRAIVFGKRADPMADLVFSAEQLAVSPQGKLAVRWGEMKR